MHLKAERHGDQWFVEGYEPRGGSFGAGLVFGFLATVGLMLFFSL